MNLKTKLITLAAASVLPVLAFAQEKPEFKIMPEIAEQLSDNGQWAISQKASEVDGSLAPAGGAIYNLATGEITNISDKSGLSGVSDITDDGNIVVGECQGKPAFWNREKNAWQFLPMPDGYKQGRLTNVTPDGKTAIGYVIPPSFSWGAYPVAYDLSTSELLSIEGIPTLDMENEDKLQNCFHEISADGRYVLGSLSMSYLMPAALCQYIYDMQNHTYKMLGFIENRNGAWKPLVNGLHFVDGCSMSHSGKFVTGCAYMVENSGGEYPREYRSAFLYDIENDTFTVYNKEGESDIVGMAVLDNGYVYAITPAQNPYASCLVRSGDYYVPLEKIFSQVYGIDYQAATGFSVTGKPLSVSKDGMTMLMLPSTSDTYLLRLKEPLADAAAKVNLLDSYTAKPASGSIMSKLSTVTLTFERQVETNCPSSRIKMVSSDGKDELTPLSNNGFTATGNTVNISFRATQLRKGIEYTLTLPKGAIRIKGDRNVTTEEIKLTFHGRGTDAVVMTEVYPADGSAVSSVDISNNPVIITFDATINIADGAAASLFREGESEPFATLNILASGNRILLYPFAEQYLFSGTDYRIVIPAGSVTDISGEGGNEEISILYHGSYIRQVSSDERIIFASNCNDMNDFILFDGDHLKPVGAPAAWGFTADYPWYFVRSSETSSDMAMASHSMYSGGGKSDDWMSTPQLFIPDEDCYLTFDAQSYLKGKNDRLKIYIYESGKVYNTFTKAVVDDIRANGDLVFDTQLDPGKEEETLEDDWTNYTVSLAKYAGKDVYVVFYNDNQDQSAVFVDNIQVLRDLKYLVTVLSSSRVVAQNNATIRGNITVASDIETYDSAHLVLKDKDGTVISEISENGLSLKKDDIYNFSFDTPLSLTIGEVNPYTIEVSLGTRSTVVSGEVRDLSFEPTKRIVIEEYSGSSCANCPLGFQAVEHIGELYPGHLIPVVLRAYGGDLHGTGIGGYVSALGFTAAPSGRINRGDILFPMVSNDTDYLFSGEGLKDSTTGEDIICWLDAFRKELAQPADMDLDISSAFDESTRTINATCTVRNALNLDNASINVFAVVTENSLETYQDNNFTSIEDPDLGEWGKGGKYGSTVYPFIVNDVARATYGASYNGTAGLIPSTIEAGKEYTVNLSVPLTNKDINPNNCELTVMLIDSGRRTILNANRVALNGSTGAVEDIAGGNSDIDVSYSDGTVYIKSDSQTSARAYAADGRLISTASGTGALTLSLDGYNGTVIVKVASEKASKAFKIMAK